MKSQRVMFIVAMLAFLIVTGLDLRAACPSTTLEEQFARSAAVFVGRATASRVEASKQVIGGRFTETTFELEDVWKGNATAMLRVRTCGGTLGNDSVTCGEGFRFEIGRRYVVFAVGDALETSSCEATERVDRADRTLQWLSDKAHRKAG